MAELQQDIEAIERLIDRANTSNRPENGKPFVIIQHNQQVLDVERFDAKPSRRTGCPKFTRQASFCEYVNQQKNGSSCLYIPTQTQFVCVLDHHSAEVNIEGWGAGWGQHRATLDLTLTPEWVAWTTKNKAKFGQREFAQFIEDNLEDVATPAPADLLDMVRTIKATQGAEFNGVVDEKSGTFSCAFAQNTRTQAGAKGELELPTEFVLDIPPYQGGVSTILQARLRFEIINGKLQLWYELMRVERVLNNALQAICLAIEKETKLTGWYGTPTP